MKKNLPENTIPKFLLQVIKPYKWWYLLMLQAPFSNAAYPLIYNYAIKLLIDLFTQNAQITAAMAFWPVFLFIFANVLLETSWRIHNFAVWRSMPHIIQDLMNKVYDYVSNHSYQFFQNNLTGSIISKVKGINDGYKAIHNALEFQVSKPVLVTIFTGAGLAFTNLKLFFIVVAFALIQGFAATFWGKKLNIIENAKEDSWHKIIGQISDNITNIFTIFSYAKKKKEAQEISDIYDKVHKPLMLKWHRVDFWMSCILAAIYWIFMASLFIYMIHLRNSGAIGVGDIAFIMSLTYIFTDSMWQSINAIKDFSQTIAAFKSSFSIMQIPQEIIDKPNASELKISKGEIVLRDVSFGYDKEGLHTLKNLNLHIKSGEKIGLVGYSGAGKSTLISLLLKNFKLDKGDILIDNQSIYDVSSDSLRSQIALIPQDTMLFHRSIGENIAYAKEGATQDEIKEAAKKAHIHEFIESLPQTYETLVGERGIKLSNGQKQRIAIARAILKNAPILILDEATSSLDSSTENHIQESLNLLIDDKSSLAKKTVIAIAHRLSTLKHMDRIIVLENGKIIESGTHEELLKNKSCYQKMWVMQAGGFLPESLEAKI